MAQRVAQPGILNRVLFGCAVLPPPIPAKQSQHPGMKLSKASPEPVCCQDSIASQSTSLQSPFCKGAHVGAPDLSATPRGDYARHNTAPTTQGCQRCHEALLDLFAHAMMITAHAYLILPSLAYSSACVSHIAITSLACTGRVSPGADLWCVGAFASSDKRHCDEVGRDKAARGLTGVSQAHGLPAALLVCSLCSPSLLACLHVCVYVCTVHMCACVCARACVCVCVSACTRST